jgi:hypothetical protein
LGSCFADGCPCDARRLLSAREGAKRLPVNLTAESNTGLQPTFLPLPGHECGFLLGEMAVAGRTSNSFNAFRICASLNCDRFIRVHPSMLHGKLYFKAVQIQGQVTPPPTDMI